ncbi:terpene synthase family protein [Actinomadura mexicana]|uniref:Terpene synthase n=1 Tax=Actinomadura mexicana TaxID=134959 RepID=A0A238XLA9_9ACTN|nr:hypothetical protein [Actinomadura mexicana]SNR59490.1 hypothetical protein SAMN06265355_104449 [Actinomadura mexicana]
MKHDLDASYPAAAQCAPFSILALDVLADLRVWASRHPEILRSVPMESQALSAASISPWRRPDQLRLPARMYMWAYAMDDHVEQNVESLAELDDLFDRCNGIVQGGDRDDGHPLLSALSDWQSELSRCPLYPHQADLWARVFSDTMRGERYDWITGRARERGAGPSDPDEYLSHAASVNAFLTLFPYWGTSDQEDLLDHLEALTSAMEDAQVAVRLVNDLCTYDRERTQPRENNILMYDTTPRWVQGELERRCAAAREQMRPLAATGSLPALETLRAFDFSIAFYERADFRGWGEEESVYRRPLADRAPDQVPAGGGG